MKKVVINKLKNKFNEADILTKHLPKYDVDQIVDLLQHEFTEGRNSDAPELSLLSGQRQDHDNELHVTLQDGLCKICGALVRQRIFDPKSAGKPLISGALV